MDPENAKDMLFIGSETNLLVYDVDNNADVFDQEVADGLTCISFGTMNGQMEPLIVAGGNCSITGFDMEAEEKFWTVTGDNVKAIEFLDWKNQGSSEMIVGSEDFAMRVFDGPEIIFDINEEAAIHSIKKIKRNIFGFALDNGTYGVYFSKKKLWKEKQSAKVTSIIGLDFETDGQFHMAIGFDNGEIEVRNHKKGELVNKVRLSKMANGKYPAVSKLFYYDYRMQGQRQVIAVGQDGSVVGFSVSESNKDFIAQVQGEDKIMSNELVDLNKQKIDLQNKMEEIEAIKKTGIDQEAANMQAMPGDEDIMIQQIADIQTKTCNLVIKLNRAGWVLRSVILFSDTVFTGGSFVVHPSQSTSTLKVPI